MAAPGTRPILLLSDDEKRVDAMLLKLKQYSIAQLEEVVVLMGFKLPTRIKLNCIPDEVAMRKYLVDYNISLKDKAFPVIGSKERTRRAAEKASWLGGGPETEEYIAKSTRAIYTVSAADLEILERLTQILQNIPRISNAARLAANKDYAAQIEADFRAEKTREFTSYCEKTMEQCQKAKKTVKGLMNIVTEIENAISIASERLTAQDEDIVPLPDKSSYFATNIWPEAVTKINYLTVYLDKHRPHVAGLNKYAVRPIRRRQHDEMLPAPEPWREVPDDDVGEEEPPMKRKKAK